MQFLVFQFLFLIRSLTTGSGTSISFITVVLTSTVTGFYFVIVMVVDQREIVSITNVVIYSSFVFQIVSLVLKIIIGIVADYESQFHFRFQPAPKIYFPELIVTRG